MTGDTRKCPDCGAALPKGYGDGKCPRCLLALGVAAAADPGRTDESNRLQAGAQLGSFVISELLGRGGMGEVYRAHDSKLGREVAIKVLAGEFVKDPERFERFEREAKMLAALDHPNIGALYEFRHDDDVWFLVLQLVEGDTLQEHIERGPIPLGEALSMFIQIAQALEAAHNKDIIHRDLKPGNIQITPKGTIKVLDFGLARPVMRLIPDPYSPTDPTRQHDPNKVTTDGSILGTPSYMSPEQARGKDIDTRSDIWAFGCCFFEALTTATPFHGETALETMVAILEDEPDWDRLPSDLPDVVYNLLRRCLEKDPRRRLRDAGDIAITLEEAQEALKRDSQKLAAPERPPVRERSASMRWLWPAGSAVALIGFATGLWLSRDEPQEVEPVADSRPLIRSLAVLPFENYSGDESQSYFVDGMTDALTAELSKVSGIKVIASRSAALYKNSEKRLHEIAAELGVDALVEGSAYRVDDEIQITAQLVHGVTEEEIVWAKNYVKNAENVLELQREVALDIVREIRVTLKPWEEQALRAASTVDPAAYEAYLLGWAASKKVFTLESLEEALAHFQRAQALDPTFAEAWESEARVHWALGAVRHEDSPPQIERLPTTVKNDRITFQLPDLAANIVSSTDERFRGKVLVLDIWGTWCPPCLKWIPFLNGFHDRYHYDGLEIVGISFEKAADEATRLSTLEDFVKANNINYTMLRGGSTREVGAVLPAVENLGAFPTTIFIGRDGTVRKVEVGFGDEKAPSIERLIEELLQESAP